MDRYLVRIDWENNAEAFWGNQANCDYWDSLEQECGTHEGGQIVLELNEAQYAELCSLPGWTHPDYPDYAPHPCTVDVISL